MLKAVLITYLITLICGQTIKQLAPQCLCDITNQCDNECCCDAECPSASITIWTNYSLCANDGFTIPYCSVYINQPIHTHDLYSGLRLIYTIIKRLFCISRVNFVNPASQFITTSTDSQIQLTTPSISVINPSIAALNPITTYPQLPYRNGMGLCGSMPAYSLNNVQSQCRVPIKDTSDLLNNKFAAVNNFFAENPSLSSIKTYQLQAPSASTQTSTSNPALFSNCVGSLCLNVIKQIKLFFSVSGGVATIDLVNSYLVLGSISVNGITNLRLIYSYQFLSNGLFPSASQVGYSIGTPLQLMMKETIGTANPNYYSMFNPINLAFRMPDGNCKDSSSTNLADATSIIFLKFGVNAVYSCSGSTSQILTNLNSAFNLVGSVGSSSNNINDFVTIQPGTITKSQSVQLIFYYVAIGLTSQPQYKIVKAKTVSVAADGGQISLFIQYQPLDSTTILNIPTPPTIDAYLPDDFLYPFSAL